MGREPILVTGMPRSGNTWLARLLATASGTALTGREPMNPRGRQYALGHTLPGWASVQTLTRRQSRALRSCYRGLNPMVYSRYGRRQWAAPLPRTRNIVKDPFAMLSLPAVVQATGARSVLVYRHPGAALTSYRRMGWQPDLDELQTIIEERRRLGLDPVSVTDLPPAGEASEPEAMGLFWAALYRMALNDAAAVPGLIVVSHAEIARGGIAAGQRLLRELDLSWTAESANELARESPGVVGSPTHVHPSSLHNLDRDPGQVASSWRRQLAPAEVKEVESVTHEVRTDLEATRYDLSPS